MSKEQRFVFMRHIEEMQSETGQKDRRKHNRKECLINVNFKIRGKKFNSYILDISNSGAFIETSEAFCEKTGEVLEIAS